MKKIILIIGILIVVSLSAYGFYFYFTKYNKSADNPIIVNIGTTNKPTIPFANTTNTNTVKLNDVSKWITADPHTHMSHCSKTLKPEDLVENMKKNKINISSLLIWNKGLSDVVQRALITGKDHPASDSEHILHADVEISYVPAAHMGHLILLGLNSLGFSDHPDIYPKSGIPIVEWAAKQKPPVVVGQAHGQWALQGENFKKVGPDVPFDFPIHLARGYVQFLELTDWYGTVNGEDMSLLTHVVSKLLNSGFKITFTGGSDFTCLSDDIGSVKTYALIKENLSYSAFLDAILKGRTVIANQPEDWINVTVEGSGVGSEIQAKAGQNFNIEVESFIGGNNKDGVVEILANGKILTTIQAGMGKNKNKITLPFSSSAWIAGRTEHALTSPIYIIVDKKPIRASAEDACYLVRYVDYLTNKVNGGSIDLGIDKDLTLAAYAEARTEFLKRFKEAGGTNCVGSKGNS